MQSYVSKYQALLVYMHRIIENLFTQILRQILPTGDSVKTFRKKKLSGVHDFAFSGGLMSKTLIKF